jgi:ssDNA-binding Zn-finger/Zn-ribbon topoisomerase 1
MNTQMNIQTAWSIVKAMGICPQCDARMVVTDITPVVFGNSRDDITYKCNNCGTEVMKTLKSNYRMRRHPRENRAS